MPPIHRGRCAAPGTRPHECGHYERVVTDDATARADCQRAATPPPAVWLALEATEGATLRAGIGIYTTVHYPIPVGKTKSGPPAAASTAATMVFAFDFLPQRPQRFFLFCTAAGHPSFSGYPKTFSPRPACGERGWG